MTLPHCSCSIQLAGPPTLLLERDLCPRFPPRPHSNLQNLLLLPLLPRAGVQPLAAAGSAAGSRERGEAMHGSGEARPAAAACTLNAWLHQWKHCHCFLRQHGPQQT